MRRKPDFEAVYAHGRRLGDEYFAMRFRQNDAGRPRIGLAVAVKTAGSAVERNRLRRIIRESFRLTQHELPAIDVVVGVRPRARAAASADLRAHLEALWAKIRA